MGNKPTKHENFIRSSISKSKTSLNLILNKQNITKYLSRCYLKVCTLRMSYHPHFITQKIPFDRWYYHEVEKKFLPVWSIFDMVNEVPIPRYFGFSSLNNRVIMSSTIPDTETNFLKLWIFNMANQEYKLITEGKGEVLCAQWIDESRISMLYHERCLYGRIRIMILNSRNFTPIRCFYYVNHLVNGRDDHYYIHDNDITHIYNTLDLEKNFHYRIFNNRLFGYKCGELIMLFKIRGYKILDQYPPSPLIRKKCWLIVALNPYVICVKISKYNNRNCIIIRYGGKYLNEDDFCFFGMSYRLFVDCYEYGIVNVGSKLYIRGMSEIHIYDVNSRRYTSKKIPDNVQVNLEIVEYNEAETWKTKLLKNCKHVDVVILTEP